MPKDLKFTRKRERSEEITSSDSSLFDFKNEGPSTYQQPPLKQFKVSASGKVHFHKKLVEKDGVQVLRDAVKFSNDKQKIKLLLREFTTDYLNLLNDSGQEESVELILKLLNTTKFVEIAEICVRSLYSIIERSGIKDVLWRKLSPGFDENLFHFQGALDSNLLALFELTVAKKIFDPAQTNLALQVSEKNLRNSGPSGRIAAIRFLIRLTLNENIPNLEKLSELEQELRVMCDDRDPRVRTAAIEGLELMCDGKSCLSIESYQRITELCSNSDINVRLIALRIILKFAQHYPEHRVESVKKFTLRLHDDAFTVVCQAMNDLDTQVRAEAARILGCFTQVSEPFLLQTLDKKLTPKMKVLNDGSTAAQTDEWSTGKKLGEDVPMEREEEEVQSLIPIQACGAFVTALEDEFMAVREAAVYSLGKLAVNRPTFANATIDHLADMFNDEIAQIRLDAIHALTPLVIHGVLGQEQLNTILTGLDDAASDNRMALHELLSRSHLADAACVKQCVQILLRTLGRFPTDRESTYRCLASIGLKHAHLVQTLAVELLGVTPVFDMQEQSIEDEIYLAKLVLVLNAASKQPVICSLTPPYVKKHYRFLRCASPHLIPKIKEYEQSIISESSVCASSSMIDLKVQSLLDNAYKRMVEAHISAGISEKSALFKLILRDLEAYQTIEEEIAVPARFLHDLCNVMNLFDIVNTGIRSGDEITTIFNIIQQAHRKIGWIESQYHGVDKKILAALRECTLFLNLIQVAILIDHIPNGQKQAPKLVQEEILAVENRFKKLDSKPSDFTTKLIHWLNEKLSETVQNGSNLEEKKDFLSGHGIIAQLTGAYIPAPETLPSLRKISMKSVQVIDPNKDVQAEKIVKFVSGLPTGVELNCMLHNLTAEDLEKFRIKIEYPDETIAYYRPRSTEFITLSNRLVRVQTTVLISAQLWAEASEIQLCCGVLLSSPQGISIGANEYTKENFFVPLPDADEPTQFNKISVKIHPVNRM